MKLPQTIYPYLSAWLVLNLVQAFFTELIHDEAYYWYYTKAMDWGFFDHPPAIAAFVKMGYGLFPNEMGVRLFIVLSSTATIWLFYKIIGVEDLRVFLSIVFGAVIIHVGGFIAVPDIPLVFFTALFFYFFKNYLEKDSWLTAFWLAISVAGMAYSKYNGALVVLLAMLPNLRLLRRPSLWMVPVLVLALYAPHLIWQYEHEFQTFRYQFLDRSNVPYRIGFFFEYLLGQLLIFGPLIGVLLFPAAVKYKAGDAFERTMKWCFYGFFGFFLLQSLQGRIEPNWTVMAAVPLFYLSYHFIKDKEQWRRLLFRLSAASLVLVFIFRIYMMYDFLPDGMLKRNEFHGWDVWAKDIEKVAGDLPVVFQNTFQKPSKYMFYTGKFAHSANVVDYAGKEYDLRIEDEEFLQGKTVFWIHYGGKDSVVTENSVQTYDITPNFHYYNRIKIEVPQDSYTVPVDSAMSLPVKLVNPTNQEVDFALYADPDLSVQYCLFWYGKIRYCQPAAEQFPTQKLAPGESVDFSVNIQTPPEKGKHWQFRLAIVANGFIGRNSHFVKYEMK